ncbi:MAG: hypothetical protein U0987_08745 [Afipia sp.]|nr:hypothetical protein [Afipia sp.]
MLTLDGPNRGRTAAGTLLDTACALEQGPLVIRRLRLPMPDLAQQFRRMVFHIVASNQRDRVWNIAILMDKPA